MANAALKANSTALILLTGGAPLPAGNPAKAASGFFVVAGPPGKLKILIDLNFYALCLKSMHSSMDILAEILIFR